MTQVFILSGTSWSIPGDWSNTNTVEAIAGGGGGGTPGSGNDATGAGAAAYSKVTNLTGLSGSVTIQVGVGGAALFVGTDTWFNGANLAGSSVGAQGGGAG